MNVFVLVILFYLLYRFILGFLVPLFRASRQMRQQFHDVNGRSNGQNNAPPNAGNPGNPNSDTGTTPKSGSTKVGEYIDFEEVK